MQAILETDRLILQELSLQDTAFIIRLLNTEGWITYIGDRNVHFSEQAKQYLEKGPLSSYRSNGFGLWLVVTKADLAPVGMCGFIKRDTLEHVDLGFAFLPEFTGKGYGYESAQVCMQYGFTHLGFERVLAIVLPTNQRSIHLLKKLGFAFDKSFTMETDKEELYLFAASNA